MERPSVIIRGLGALLAIIIMTGMPKDISLPDFKANKVDATIITTESETENDVVTIEPSTMEEVAEPSETEITEWCEVINVVDEVITINYCGDAYEFYGNGYKVGDKVKLLFVYNPDKNEWEVTDVLETETETEIVEETLFFDVPLSEELQLHIFAECEKHNIAPAIIIAMIEKESSYRPHIKGDNGNSYGLMQIMQKYQKARMEKLGCTDLLDPFQNVTVGIDLVAELRDKNDDLYWVLMTYNGGQSYANKLYLNQGKVSKYALYVTERASELERELYGE